MQLSVKDGGFTMKKYVALLLVLIFALSFMSAVAFAEGEVKSPEEDVKPAPVDKPVVSPQTGIGGNLYLIGALALTVCAADAALLKKISA